MQGQRENEPEDGETTDEVVKPEQDEELLDYNQIDSDKPISENLLTNAKGAPDSALMSPMSARSVQDINDGSNDDGEEPHPDLALIAEQQLSVPNALVERLSENGFRL
jgi:hypothetical protein